MVKYTQYIVIFGLLTSLITGCEIPLGGFFIGDSATNTRFQESMEINNTSSQTRKFSIDREEYDVLLGADLHLHTSPTRFSRFLSIASQGYLFSSIVGDYIYELGASVAPVVDSLKKHPSIQFIPVIGNHEVYKDKWADYKNYFGSSVYYFSVEGKRFEDLYLVLDSGNGTLGEDQLDWLKTWLPALRPNYRHCVILTHNNFFRPHGSTSLTALFPQDERYLLFDLFAKNNVDLVVTGHDHSHDETTMKGVIYLSLAALRQEISPSELCRIHFGANGLIEKTFIDVDKP